MPPKAYSLAAAAKALSLSKRTVERRVADKAIAARRDGGKLLIMADELDRYLASLPAAEDTKAAQSSKSARRLSSASDRL